jgi:hypothetical protein
MTITRPLRLMILHFSHIGFTEGLTFTRIPPYFIIIKKLLGSFKIVV